MLTIIIIPTYNEKDNIENTIEALKREFKKIPNHEMHILVADDTSPDGTAEIVKKLAERYSNIHLILNKKKEGLGAAYMQAMRYAIEKLKAEIVFEFDADGSHQPKYLPGMMREFDKGADVVVGSRYIKGGSIPKEWAFHRKLFSLAGNLIARLVLWIPRYHDATTGYRGSKTEFLEKAKYQNLISKRFAYKIHLFYALHKAGAKIVEFPIEFLDRTKGKSKIPRNEILESLRVIFTLRLTEHKIFIKVCIIGFIGFIVNALGLVILVEIFNMHPAFANVFAAEAAIVSNFLWNNFWTFKDRRHKASPWPWRFIQFNFASIGSLVISSSVIWAGVVIFGHSLYMTYMVIGVLLGLIWNYLMYSRWVWRK